jgi:hypothetical protein
MYGAMCEYEPDTPFTLDMLMSEARNTREETDEILNELLNAAYVFRTDEQNEGKPAYVVNRVLLPNQSLKLQNVDYRTLGASLTAEVFNCRYLYPVFARQPKRVYYLD